MPEASLKGGAFFSPYTAVPRYNALSLKGPLVGFISFPLRNVNSRFNRGSFRISKLFQKYAVISVLNLSSCGPARRMAATFCLTILRIVIRETKNHRKNKTAEQFVFLSSVFPDIQREQSGGQWRLQHPLFSRQKLLEEG
jgi:hypothetical protein